LVSMSNEKSLDKIVNLETIMDFEWLNRLIMEALRFQSPTRITSNMATQ